ncbi:MAG: hypothetical protein MZU97_09915 [Bacillus subtilis]|nr:hypothetical protein [Bacillus subtilis]
MSPCSATFDLVAVETAGKASPSAEVLAELQEHGAARLHRLRQNRCDGI